MFLGGPFERHENTQSTKFPSLSRLEGRALQVREGPGAPWGVRPSQTRVSAQRGLQAPPGPALLSCSLGL